MNRRVAKRHKVALGRQRTLCGLELAKLDAGVPLVRADVRTLEGVTCKVCCGHFDAEQRALQAPPVKPSDLRSSDLARGFSAAAQPALAGLRAAALRGSCPECGEPAQLYRRAVMHIAGNDDPATLELESIRQYPSVQLVSDVFSVRASTVARDVLNLRVALG